MGHTASHVADSQVLAEHARLTLQDGRCTFQVNTEAGKSVYTINDGANSISKLLVWPFGVWPHRPVVSFRAARNSL